MGFEAVVNRDGVVPMGVDRGGRQGFLENPQVCGGGEGFPGRCCSHEGYEQVVPRRHTCIYISNSNFKNNASTCTEALADSSSWAA